jgi:hypothetical protein
MGDLIIHPQLQWALWMELEISESLTFHHRAAYEIRISSRWQLVRVCTWRPPMDNCVGCIEPRERPNLRGSAKESCGSYKDRIMYTTSFGGYMRKVDRRGYTAHSSVIVYAILSTQFFVRTPHYCCLDVGFGCGSASRIPKQSICGLVFRHTWSMSIPLSRAQKARKQNNVGSSKTATSRSKIPYAALIASQTKLLLTPRYRAVPVPNGFQPLTEPLENETFDWDSVEQDANLELWAVRIPKNVRVSFSLAYPCHPRGSCVVSYYD